MTKVDLTTKEACLEILRMYHNWNHGQKSVDLAFNGTRTDEDAIYDARRVLIRQATERLTLFLYRDTEARFIPVNLEIEP